MSISFMHISDVMLGIEPDKDHPWSTERAGEIYETFENIVEEAERRKVDLLIVAGNLFSHVPDEAELDWLNGQFGKLTQTAVVYVTGTKDYIGEGAAVLSYRFCPWVYVMGCPDAVAESSGEDRMAVRDSQATMAVDCLHFASKGVCIYGVSCFGRSGLEVRDIFDPDENEKKIFVCCMDEKGHMPVNASALKAGGFSYVALGGRLSYEARRGGRMCSSGSPEALDIGGTHGYIYGEIDDEGVRTALVPVSKREYKLVEYPVSNYTGEVDLISDILRILGTEGSGNIYTVNIKRTEGCEKSFDIGASLKGYRILSINGDRFVRNDYEMYVRANRNNELGGLLDRLGNAGLDEREGIKLAVDELIDMSGLYRRRNKKMSAEMFRDARRQVLQLLRARCDGYENDEAVKAYESARKEYEVSPDVLDELNEVWANERRTELEIKTLRTKKEDLPRQYRRLWVKAGIRTALIPLMVAGMLSVVLLPLAVSGEMEYSVNSVLLSTVFPVVLTLLAYYAGYGISRRLGGGKTESRAARLRSELETVGEQLAELDRIRADYHTRRVELQALDGQKREMKDKLGQKEKELEGRRYQISITRSAIEVLSGIDARHL